MLNTAFARSFVSKIKRRLNLNVNIMNEQGIIIASANAERIGAFHSCAYEIIKKRIPEQLINSVDETMIGVTGPGVNLLLTGKNQTPIGAVGVSGNTEGLLQIARTIKFALETELEYQQKKTHCTPGSVPDSHAVLAQALLSERPMVPSRVLQAAKRSALNPSGSRLCILACMSENNTYLLKALSDAFLHCAHEYETITLFPDASHLVLLLSLGNDTISQCMERFYQYAKSSWSRILSDESIQGPPNVQYLISTPQKDLLSCGYCYDLMCTLEQTLPACEDPFIQVKNHLFPLIFESYSFNIWEILYEESFQRLNRSFDLVVFQETINALSLSNMHLEQASRRLFIHKNTLSMRIRKIREILGLQITGNMQDYLFLQGLLYYIHKRDLL